MEIADLIRPGVTRPDLDPAVRAAWLTAVHEAARTRGGAVTAPIDEPAVGRNYYRTAITARHGRPTVMLLNPVARLVAATVPPDPVAVTAAGADVPAPFADAPAPFAVVPAPGVFVRHGFSVAPPAELEQPLKPGHLRLLTAEERRDVAYHRPDRLGDLLFNWFD